MLNKTLPAAALAALIAGPTLAGSLDPVDPGPVVTTPPPAPIAYSGDWTGGYVGAQLGYGDLGGGASGNGEIAGLHAGYNWDFGGWVFGTELDHDFTNIDVGTAGDEVDGVTRLKLRAGADLGRTLIYGTVGAAHASATIGGVDMSDNGWVGGIGVAYQLNDQWTLGGEVLNHDFSNFDDSGTDVYATTATVRASFNF